MLLYTIVAGIVLIQSAASVPLPEDQNEHQVRPEIHDKVNPVAKNGI